ncbi:MAG TPA: 16S rRNA (cytosine(967)-C(5))-methyltransferase RsmB [Myxococcales bacterium]|nr:16S rRNA (cytosine(967)-C(5))-methyltransferase RsmB [Myxococcales bacterium]
MASPRVSGARAAAAEALLRVERDQAYAGVSLQAALAERPGLDPRDAALASELVLGTLRFQLALDHAIAAAADRPLEKLELPVLLALRLAVYQLRHTRVPAHAAVHESVELVKAAGIGRAAGFVNAILRRIQRGPAAPLPADPLDRLSVEQSHPLWLVRRWADRLGLEEARALCEANNRPAPLTLRVNVRRSSPEALTERLRETSEREGRGPDPARGPRVVPGRWAAAALLVEGAGPPSSLPGHAEGSFQVQDEAAQLVGLWAAAPGATVLDVCAAPGGKACQLAELGATAVIALDVSRRKLGRVEEEARRLGDTEVRCVTADARVPLPFRGASLRHVLVDAPCSGLGTLRRHPEVRYRRTEADVVRLAALQRQILQAALETLAPGGVLTYAVCSTEPEEGEAHLADLLRERPDLGVAPPEPGWARTEDGLVTSAGLLATWPHRHGIDGFVAFRVRRR